MGNGFTELLIKPALLVPTISQLIVTPGSMEWLFSIGWDASVLRGVLLKTPVIAE